MPADLRIVRSFDAFATQREKMVARISTLVIAQFDGFDGWYSPRLIDEITAEVAALVSAGQLGVAALTDAYLARVTSYVFDRAVSGAGVSPAMAATLRKGPADQAEVYGRLVAGYRFLVSQGDGQPAALQKTLVRADEMVGTDLALAHQRQVLQFNRSRGVTKYRRVIRAENTCGLCVSASQREYNSDDLLPIHARCKCGVIAVSAGGDPGLVLNNESLADLYKAARSTGSADLKRVRVTVQQNGELGPQLRIEGQHFRGPDDIPAAA